MAAANNYSNVAKSFFEEVYSKGNVNYCDEVLAKNIRLIDPSAPDFRGGVQGFKDRESAYHKAFPGKVAKIDEIYESGDNVIVKWTVSGKHKGDLPSIPATGSNINVSGITIFKFEGGKIAEITQAWDRLGLLEQIGQVQAKTAHALS